MIDHRWMRWLLPGVVAIALAFVAYGLASLGLQLRGEPGAWFGAVLAAPFAFVFVRAARSLSRAAAASSTTECRIDALGDVVRALQLAGGFAIVALVLLPIAVLVLGVKLLGG